jgi:predicted nucleic acid-binding protein
VSRLVVDASVAARWLIPQQRSDVSEAVLDPQHELLAPDFIRLEIGNVLWKYRRAGLLSDEEVITLHDAFPRFGIREVRTASVLRRAVEVALQLECSVYDAVYLAVAESETVALWTADRRLANRVAESKMVAISVQLLD